MARQSSKSQRERDFAKPSDKKFGSVQIRKLCFIRRNAFT
jgi:hypothetical protein